MASMRSALRRRRSITVVLTPSASARATSTALAVRTSSVRATRRSAAARRAASLSAEEARASAREAALARRPSSATVEGRHEARGYRPPPDRLHRLTPRCDGSSRCWVPSSWWPWPCSCVRPSIRATTVGAAAGTTPLRSCSAPRSWPEVCQTLADDGLADVTIEPVGTTVDRLGAVDADLEADAWLTLDPFSAAGERPPAVRHGQPAVRRPARHRVLDRAGAGRPGRPRRRPRGRLRRGRLGLRRRRRRRALGRPRRGDQLGTVKPGYDAPDTSATGLLVLAQAMADHLERSRLRRPGHRRPLAGRPGGRRAHPHRRLVAPQAGPAGRRRLRGRRGPRAPTPRPWRGPPRERT